MSVLTTSLLSGCGAIIGMRAGSAQFDLAEIPDRQLIESDPVSSPVFHRVQSVAVANVSELLEGYPEDNIRLYKAMTKQLEKSLTSTSKYRVITATQFKRALEENKVDLDYSSADEEEIAEALAFVTRKLGAHAYVSLNLDSESDNVNSYSEQMSYTKQVLLDGEIRIPMELSLQLVRAKTSETLYKQASYVNWVSGTQGLKTTKSARLNSIVKQAVDPLIKDMTSR